MSNVTNRRPLGSVRWRPHRNAYEIRYYLEPAGRRHYASAPGPESEAAERGAQLQLAALLAAADRGERPTDRRLTVGRWLDEWLELQVGVRPSTRKAYADRARLYVKPVLGSAKLADLDAVDVTRAFARLATMRSERTEQLSPGTIDAAFRMLSGALADAVDMGRAPRNACRGAKVPRSNIQIEPPSQAELDQLFDAIGAHPWRAVFSVMRWTGARHGEVLGLERRHVNWSTGELRLMRQASGSLKTRHSVRSVIVPPAVLAELAAVPVRVGSPYLFNKASGKPLTERAVLRVFDAALQVAGIRPDAAADMDKYRPHDLRHAFATMLLEAGVAPHVVARWLGHASLSMLDRYAHVRAMPGGDAYARLVAAWGPDAAYAFGLRPERIEARAQA